MTLAVCGAFYNPRKATCGEYWIYCYGYSDETVSPSSFSVAVNGTVQLDDQATYADGTGYDFTSSSSWSSNPTAVATVGPNTGLVTGKSAGSVVITVELPSLVVTTGEICSNGAQIPCPTANLGSGAGGTVADGTPDITSVTPYVWLGGATTTVTLDGEYFGTNAPGLSVTGVMLDGQPTIVSHSDTQIVFTVTVDPNDPGNTASIVVTSNGYDANGFISFPNGGSVASSPPGAGKAGVPTNFHMTGSSDQGGGALPLLQAVFNWQSSTGSKADLSACQIRENVTYPNTNNSACPSNNPAGLCYYPTSPPWPTPGQAGTGYPNPTLVSGSANSDHINDNDAVTNLNFVEPYSTNSFNGTQYFQYTCNGSTWTNIYGPATITRSMSQNSQQKWVVTVSRSDTSTTSTYVIPGQ
jgi:hypothetical protein